MSEDCYWISNGDCYFEHLLENNHEGLIIDIIREVPKAREDILDGSKCNECDFPERFVEEAKDPSPPNKSYKERQEDFQEREWDRLDAPNKDRNTSGTPSEGPVISNEDLREREEFRREVRGDDE